MTTLEMEILVMRYFGVRRNIIVPNISWGMDGLHECDVLSLSSSGYATEIEIKVSKADLLKDSEKRHGHRHRLITNLYFAVPEKLEQIALENIPKRAGLLVVKKKLYQFHNKERNYSANILRLVKPPIRDENATKWTDTQIMKLTRLGTMRILGMKEKIFKLKQS